VVDVLIVAPNVFWGNWGLACVLCAGFVGNSKLFAEVMNSIREPFPVGRIVSVELCLITPGDDKFGDLHACHSQDPGEFSSMSIITRGGVCESVAYIISA